MNIKIFKEGHQWIRFLSSNVAVETSNKWAQKSKSDILNWTKQKLGGAGRWGLFDFSYQKQNSIFYSFFVGRRVG